MANKAEDMDKKSKKDKKNKKKKKPLIPLILLLAITAGMYFGRHTIAVYTQDIPILNTIFKLPDSEDATDQRAPEELLQELERVSQQLQSAQLELEQQNTEIEELRTQITFLEEYEANYTEFQAQKEEWDRSLAEEQPDLFVAQVEAMYPDLVAQIYQEITVEDARHKEYDEYVAMIEGMDEEKAAEVLAQLLLTDTVLVAQIFEYMTVDAQAEILNQMEADVATQIIKLVSPNE